MTPKDKAFFLAFSLVAVVCFVVGYFIHWGFGAIIFIGFLIAISRGNPNDITPEEAVRMAEQKRKR
ncbi:MAG: hypothetical protein WC657_04215 [Candidatus Paceibacterota bacterium]|jgi:hypothetical protein